MTDKKPLLTDLMPPIGLDFVKIKGDELLKRIGHDELRGIVAGVLCGENVRASTEPLTRRRLSILNGMLVLTLVRASAHYLADELLDQAYKEWASLKSSDPRRIVLMWLLGLTNKQIQNVLRSETKAWVDFINQSKDVIRDSAEFSAEQYGALDALLDISDLSNEWDWLWAHYLMMAVGSQTLATRGAEKSMYGKFFEKLILGSVLDILGFSFDSNREGAAMTFWLSDRGEKRESDATAIISSENGIRFDIGFIGSGNTEISLDKVSRFSRVEEVAGKRHDMTTIIIVDRIGDGSRITDLAATIDGHILQMSSSLWAKELDSLLARTFSEYQRVFSEDADVDEIKMLVDRNLSSNDLTNLISAV